MKHKGSSAISWEQYGRKMFDLSVKDSGEVLGGLSNLGLSQASMPSSIFDVIAVILSGRSIDKAKFTMLDDLTVTTSISDMGEVTRLAQQLASARRNYADMKTMDQYTQQMNELVKS